VLFPKERFPDKISESFFIQPNEETPGADYDHPTSTWFPQGFTVKPQAAAVVLSQMLPPKKSLLLFLFGLG
jgi:hypothetical protein